MTQKQMRKGVIKIENYSGNALYDFAGRLNNKFKAYELYDAPPKFLSQNVTSIYFPLSMVIFFAMLLLA